MRGSSTFMGLALLALAACAQAPGPENTTEKPLLSDPQVLGSVSFGQDMVAQTFATYSFPNGAPNATAWFGHRNDIYYLNIRAFPDANPEAASGILSVVAILPDAPLAGMASDSVTVKLLDHGPIRDRPMWSSVGHPAHLEILSLVPDVGSTPASATVTASLSATLCNRAAPADQPDCRDMTGVVSSVVQYDYP